jgi:CheY-like chemotaxis protein
VKVAPRRILIVDDNVALAENIAEILAFEGHATEVARSAEEALPRVLAETPDVVVTDYRLPGISGAAFVRQFRQTCRDVRAVVISAYTDDRTIRETQEAGAAFIPKPVDFILLSQLVRDSVG